MAVISNLTTQRNAIEMLQIRVRILLEYLKDTEAGVIPVDHDIERQISSLCNRLPVVNNKDFNAEFLKVRSDLRLGMADNCFEQDRLTVFLNITICFSGV